MINLITAVRASARRFFAPMFTPVEDDPTKTLAECAETLSDPYVTLTNSKSELAAYVTKHLPAIKKGFIAAVEKDSQKAFLNLMKCFVYLPKNLREEAWTDITSAVDKSVSEATVKYKAMCYTATIVVLLPPHETEAFFERHKENIGPLLSLTQRAEDGKLPVFTLNIGPREDHRTFLELYRPYLTEIFAAKDDVLKSDSAARFVGAAYKAYQVEDASAPIPPYLVEAHRNIMLASLSRIFTAAKGGGAETKDELFDNLERIASLTLRDDDPVITTSHNDASLYRLDTSGIEENGDTLHILCQHTGQKLVPVFAAQTTEEITTALHFARINLTSSTSLTSDDVEAMATRMNALRPIGEWKGYAPIPE